MSHSGHARISANDRFEDVWRHAQINRLWERLTKRRKTLIPFAPIHSRLFYPSGINQGVREIPVNRIVGSLSRASEFDRDFRPLYKEQRKRWANVWRLHKQEGWEPILVHQIGDLYFVEDGHHRTSVARDLGLETIEAIVIAYPVSISINQTTRWRTSWQTWKLRLNLSQIPQSLTILHSKPNLSICINMGFQYHLYN